MQGVEEKRWAMSTAKAFGKSSREIDPRETARLAALAQLDLLDTPKDEGLERIVRLIKEIFSVDIGLISLIDAHRQWYKSCSGLSAEGVPREDSFCRYVVVQEQPVVVQDASKDGRFSTHPAVTGEEHIRFYAGVPLLNRDGHVLGTVCAIDRQPRSFGNRDLRILQELAGAAMDRIEILQYSANDGLTEALTRRAFKQEADELLSLALRQGHDLSCIVLDIDHFKQVNDTCGHAAGDDVLKTVASICKSVLGAGNPFGRLGGEEFAILLPKVDRNGAMIMAEMIRAAIAERPITGAFGFLNVTASFGVSSLSIVGKDIDTLLAQADAAMYKAKQTGRNQCISWSTMNQQQATGARRRVLKAGSIIFNNRRSAVDCTVKSLGCDSAGLSVFNSAGIPSEFILAIKGEGFETNCQIIAQDRQNIEVIFG